MRNEQVERFLDSLLIGNNPEQQNPIMNDEFTVTVATPAESGPLHGWRILTLETPGRYDDSLQEFRGSLLVFYHTHRFSWFACSYRLGRLTVRREGVQMHVKTANVRTFTLDIGRLSQDTQSTVETVVVNGVSLDLPSNVKSGILHIQKDTAARKWKVQLSSPILHGKTLIS